MKPTHLEIGNVIIFPTDTAFGIGCRIDDSSAIERLYIIRKRSRTKAVPVLVSDIHMAKEYGVIGPDVEKLLQKFWPGGLTVVVKAKVDKVPNLVRGGGSTVGLRMPDHPDLSNLIKHTGVPILGPSANFAGDPTPYTEDEIDKQLKSEVDYVMPGTTSNNIHSTVLDVTRSPWKILRQGAIPKEILNIKE